MICATAQDTYAFPFSFFSFFSIEGTLTKLHHAIMSVLPRTNPKTLKHHALAHGWSCPAIRLTPTRDGSTATRNSGDGGSHSHRHVAALHRVHQGLEGHALRAAVPRRAGATAGHRAAAPRPAGAQVQVQQPGLARQHAAHACVAVGRNLTMFDLQED